MPRGVSDDVESYLHLPSKIGVASTCSVKMAGGPQPSLNEFQVLAANEVPQGKAVKISEGES